uniref:Ferrous iron transport protein B n=1 Tax=Schlesneria paludicola TaxID=360056 RepID=A0A7C4LNJ3_9PLAN
MLVSSPSRPVTVAVLGNPNTGKSTLFTALTGVHSRVGNYPGVTVEKKVGWFEHAGRRVQLIDLPGTYSLSPRTKDEMVSVEVLLGRQADVGPIDAVICIVDAANLERNLYVVSQVLDTGLPVVLVLNMWDVAQARGMTIDVEALSHRLGLPVVPCEAHRRKNLEAVKDAVLHVVNQPPRTPARLFSQEFYREIEALRARFGAAAPPDYLLERLLLDPGGQVEALYARTSTDGLAGELTAARERLRAAGFRIPSVEAKVRYGWARQVLQGAVRLPEKPPETPADRVDRWLTHRLWGLLLFCVLMFVVFQSIYTGAKPLMDAIEAAQQFVAAGVERWLPPGPLRSLLVDGVIAGVGGVLTFLPQIALLFLFIAILEDCGYMARAAFLMDKLMTKVGLSGKSFVPLMSSFACAVPGIMATRVIENRRDRMVTILVAPLMSCSARLPVYVLLIGAFVPDQRLGGWLPLQGSVLFAMTALGAVVAVPVAWILRQSLFRGETPPFVMELPTYKWPSPSIVLHRVYDRVRAFVVRAGTLIFATNVLVWAACYFPGSHAELDQVTAQLEALAVELTQPLAERARLTIPSESVADDSAGGTDRAARLAALEKTLSPYDTLVARRNQLAEQLLEQSFLGQVGRALAPAVQPLGWDWRIGVGVLASFPAREVIISTLGTIYSLGSDVGAEHAGLKDALRAATWPDGRPVYTLPVALSLMVFFALCAQCASTLMVIQRETNHAGWAVFTFAYMTALAYLGALATYQWGTLWLG